jgi:flagellar basal-body rod protein FlgF
MDNAVYTGLSRQSGLMREMQLVAHNVANLATTGFRREGMVFAEHIRRLGDAPSLSLTHGNGRVIDLSQGDLARTGGSFDFAIRGEGFFLVETPGGDRLTRAGHFTPNAEGELVSADGHRLLDAGGAPVFVPPDARSVTLATDGTLAADGVPLAEIGLWRPADPLALRHEAGTLFAAEGYEPAEPGGAVILQGHLEGSNVNPVTEIARMIELSRAYELGQNLMQREDERIRAVVQTLGR